MSATATASREEGLFGPDSVTWKVNGHPAALVGGLRALIVQSLHPLAMAGVAQHSDYRHRPLDRLRRTALYVAATTYGGAEEAERAAEMVRRKHRRVKGVDPVTGREYSADDPDTALWVHCVEVHSFLVAYRTYGGGLAREEQDRYLAESARVAALLGVPSASVPDSVEAMRAYFEEVRPGLCMSEASRDAIELVLSPPADRELAALRPVWPAVAAAAVAIVPRHLRRLVGIDRPRAVDIATIAAARPVLAVMGHPPLSLLLRRLLGPDVAAVARG